MTIPWYLDVYKKKIFSDDMTEDEKKEAIKKSCTYSFSPAP